MANVDKLSTRYIWQGLGIGLLLMLLAYPAVTSIDMKTEKLESATHAIYISFGFFMFVNVVEAIIWRKVANNSPKSLPTFFTAVSGGRLLLALAVMFVFYLVKGRSAMLPFFVVFMVFYVAQLLHHVSFFSHSEHRPDELTNN